MPGFLPFSIDDLPALLHLNPPDWGDITPAFQQYLLMEHCTPLKLVLENRMIGVGCAIHLGMTGWLGHIIVHPEFRSQGLGALITRVLVDLLQQKGVKTIMLIATELGEPVYRKLGFTTETQYVFYKTERKREVYLPAENIISYTAGFQDAVLKLDQLISGEDRSKWIIPQLPQTKLYLKEGHVQGFYIPGLGDGLIYAVDAGAGHALMHDRLQDHTDAVLPTDNSDAIDLLKQQGFTMHRKAARMWLGEKHSWKPECVYNRISGALG